MVMVLALGTLPACDPAGDAPVAESRTIFGDIEVVTTVDQQGTQITRLYDADGEVRAVAHQAADTGTIRVGDHDYRPFPSVDEAEPMVAQALVHGAWQADATPALAADALTGSSAVYVPAGTVCELPPPNELGIGYGPVIAYYTLDQCRDLAHECGDKDVFSYQSFWGTFGPRTICYWADAGGPFPPL